jgi:hypothetical protein
MGSTRENVRWGSLRVQLTGGDDGDGNTPRGQVAILGLKQQVSHVPRPLKNRITRHPPTKVEAEMAGKGACSISHLEDAAVSATADEAIDALQAWACKACQFGGMPCSRGQAHFHCNVGGQEHGQDLQQPAHGVGREGLLSPNANSHHLVLKQPLGESTAGNWVDESQPTLRVHRA